MTAFYERIITLRSASICIAILVTGSFAARVHAGDFTKSYSVSHRANVHVDTNDGNVRITTGDTNEVEFHVVYKGYELNKTLHIESHQQGDEVELTARLIGKLPFSLIVLATAKLDIEVRMPKDGDLQVESGDGSIKVGGLAGTIDLHSGDGGITVNSLMGVMRLHSGDGAIDGSNLDGQCDAVSGDGRIHLVGRFDVLRAKSGDGGIKIGAVHGSTLISGWNIASGDGSIEVALPIDLSVDIDASTSDGSISSDIPLSVEGVISKSRVRGKINGGGQTLTIHSGDGGIRLKQV
jgi:hypothetical protein